VGSGALVDDSVWVLALRTRRTTTSSRWLSNWEDWEDSVGGGFAKDRSAPDHGDDDHDGDYNHDHCVDDGNRDWRKRHDRR
jgi:hypothetical protein